MNSMQFAYANVKIKMQKKNTAPPAGKSPTLIGVALAALRENVLGKKQGELADALGVDQSTLSRYEQDRPPKGAALRYLLLAFLIWGVGDTAEYQEVLRLSGVPPENVIPSLPGDKAILERLGRLTGARLVYEKRTITIPESGAISVDESDFLADALKAYRLAHAKDANAEQRRRLKDEMRRAAVAYDDSASGGVIKKSTQTL